MQAIKELVRQKENGETKNPHRRYQTLTNLLSSPHPLFHRPFLTPHPPNPKSPKSTHPSHPNSITARKNIAALKLSPRSFGARLWCCCAETLVKGEVGGGWRCETWGGGGGGGPKGEVGVVGERVMRVL